MCEERQYLGVAQTIEDLNSLVRRAIVLAGKNAFWDVDKNDDIRIYSDHKNTIFIIGQLSTDTQAPLHQDRRRRENCMTFEDWWEEATTRYGIRCWGIRMDVVKLVAEVAWTQGFSDGCIKTSNLVRIGSDSDDAKAGSKAE